MNAVAWLVVSAGAGMGGLLLCFDGWRQPRPPLDRVIAHLRRPGPIGAAREQQHAFAILQPLRAGGRRLASIAPRLFPSAVELRLVDRSLDAHVGVLACSALVGALGPIVALGVLQVFGVVSLGVFVPLGVALAGLIAGPLAVHAEVVERAREVETDLRFQLSAYLDVVTMLLAGNSGHEGALEQAARAGDGRLFVELRRRMREVGTTGKSLVEALSTTADELGLVELQQVAATTALSSAEGAPVARTLAAKCSTLRSTLATEQESEARLRTSRLTAPIVGMALIFMALVIYPALSFS
ncbi:MAG TPA: type II secretion system F family protein [Ilumatobacteraceae bacterium]|nr:type II secretion system F family protein [Ilumatobacteraceae bacterium]